MDALYTAVIRLHEQGSSKKEISRRLNISHGKVTKILVTAGLIETEESRLYQSGMTVAQIADKLEKNENAVLCRIPYEKGMYNAEYPSINAMRIRKSRQGKQ